MIRSARAVIGGTLLVWGAAFGLEGTGVVLVSDPDLAPPARYGLAQLERALGAKGFSVERSERAAASKADFAILAGLGKGGGPAARALQASGVPLPAQPESLVIRRAQVEGRPAVVLCGSDARGLMYAALDAAESIAASPLRAPRWPQVREAAETPFVRERGVSIYTMQRRYFESRLYDEKYWEGYFDLLARSRINNFVVIFGYENGGFLAPVYPYFFDTEGFPEVRFTGLTPAGQQRNVAAFKAMIRIAHERGVEVTAAIWDHIYRGGVQGGGIAGANETAGQALPWLVTGVTERNLIPYTRAALRRFLEVFPELDGLQFRMHGESGLKREEMESFWHDVFTMLRQHHPKIRVDLRAKELPDSIIADALAQGLQARVTTKYWMEQMGLPFHPSHVNRQNQHDRRHGYADLLRHPQRYGVHWRLWNGGTTRLLLWADPDYVRRFAASTRLYGDGSFEVNEMLATKMLGEPHDAPPRDILNAQYRYYDYEFERYWHFYQLWGRLGYNPDTPAALWEREFRRRLGDQAGVEAMQALHLASRVLPRIVAASYLYRNFPTTRGWAEMMSQGDLVQYAAMEGSDIEQFMNVRDRARGILDGTDVAMRTPEATSRWFADLSDRILRHVERARQAAGERPAKELLSTLTDARILAWLARFHAHRLDGGLSYALFKETGDLFSLDDALASEKQAVAAWEQVVTSAGDVYHADLAFGVHRVGFPRHWKEELGRLRAGLQLLEEQRRKAATEAKGFRIAHVPVRQAAPGGRVLFRATVVSPGATAEVQVHIILPSGEPRALAMRQSAAPGMFEAEIATPGAAGLLKYFIEVSDGSGSAVLWPPRGREEPAEIQITSDRDAPRVELLPVTPARPGEDLEVAVRAEDPAGIKTVRLRYRHITQYEDYRTAEMTLDPARGVHRAVIPGQFITRDWDLMYFVEAVDGSGNGGIAPDLEHEAPYRLVRVAR